MKTIKYSYLILQDQIKDFILYIFSFIIVIKGKHMEYIAFTKVKLPFGWLGNMAPFPVIHEDIKYRTTEALFQCLRFKDYPEVQEKIRSENSPMGAKMVAKSFKKLLDQDDYVFMGSQDIAYMRICLDKKIIQHSNLVPLLLDTKNIPIIEDCSSRPHGSGLFWGAALKDNQWVGENILGKMWVDIRQELALQIKVKPLRFPKLN